MPSSRFFLSYVHFLRLLAAANFNARSEALDLMLDDKEAHQRVRTAKECAALEMRGLDAQFDVME